MTENLRIAFAGIWSHKLRSFLTMLGVIIGIASIIAIVSTIKGTNEQIMKNLIGAGNNNVTVRLKQGSDDYWMDQGIPQGVMPVSQEMKEQIRDLDDVKEASFYMERSYVDDIRCGSQSLSQGRLAGVDMQYLSTCGYVVYKGRPFAESDFKTFRKAALLDETAARALFPDGNALGKIIEIKGEPFTVAGLYRRAEAFKPVINNLQDYMTYYTQDYGTVLIPDADWPILYGFDEPQICAARAVSTDAMSDVGRQVEEIMSSCVYNNEEISYKADDLVEKAKNRQDLSSSTNSMLIWIASIALLVGGIGVMNIMLVSVTERTSEIGLKKALGARRKTILIQFLTESAVLTSIGGVIGVAAGIALAMVISRLTGAPAAVSVPAIILSVAFSMVIGIVFGLLPSVKAANLSPIDALRRE